MFIKKVQTTLSAGLVAAAAMAGSAQAETLSLAHFVPPGHTITSSTIVPLQEAVAAMAPDLEIKVYPGGELGKGPLEQYVRALQGVADITWGLQGYTSSQFKKTMISELPTVKTGKNPGYKLLWDAYEAGHLDGEFPGTVPLALYLSEPNIFIMKDHDVRKPKDVAGLKLRVSGAASAEVVEALGATPVQMPITEVYNALQTGLIDGVLTGASAVGDFKLDEVANSYTIGAGLGHISFYLVMNEKRYNGLSAKHRAAIDSIAGRKLSQSAEEGWEAKANQVVAALKASGDNTVIELNKRQAAAFNKLTVPVTEANVAKVRGGDEVYKVMRGK